MPTIFFLTSNQLIQYRTHQRQDEVCDQNTASSATWSAEPP